MRVRILTAFSVVLLLSVGIATAAAARKQRFPASQQLSESYGGTFSTKANSSFFAPFYKKQGCSGRATAIAADRPRARHSSSHAPATAVKRPALLTLASPPAGRTSPFRRVRQAHGVGGDSAAHTD